MNLIKKDALYYYNKIEPLQKEGLWWQVVDAFEKVLELTFEPKRELLLKYIDALEKMKRFNKIIEIYQQFYKKNHLNSDEFFSYAYALEQCKENDLAQKFFSKAIELDQTKQAKLFGKAVFYESKGDWLLASKSYAEYFKGKKLSIQMSYKQGLAYDRCYEWEKAEKVYLEAILNSDEEINFYHRLGIVQERQKKYDKAIESYLVAVFKHKQHLAYFYYRLGFVLVKKEQYKEACEAFLMMKKRLLVLDKVKNREIEKENGVVLHQYLLENESLSCNGWIEFAKKAEALKSWPVAEYAYREYLSREESFKENIYFLLASTLVQQEKYQEATEFFLEQRVIQDAHGLIETEYHNNKILQKSINYTEYYERFLLDEKLIIYEGYSDSNGNSIVYDICMELQKDVHFDEYRHVWISNGLEEVPKNIKSNSSIIVVSRGSDLYMRYLARAKYLINNSTFPNYFIQKEGQFCLNDNSLGSKKILEVIEDIFFKNSFYFQNKQEKKSILFYAGAFIPNGVTTSFLNLINLIDKDKYEIYLVIEEDKVMTNKENLEQFNRLSKNINIIRKTSTLLITLEERWIISKFSLQHTLSSNEMYEILDKAYFREYKRVFKQEKFDLIINFEGYSQYWLRVFSSVQDIPSVLYLHNDILGEATIRFPYLFANMKLYKNYNKLVSVSKDSHEINQKNIDVENNNFDYCTNFLNPQEIIDKSKALILDKNEQNIFINSRVFINVARLSPEKGQDRLIKAFFKLSSNFSDVKLIIIGQGPLKESLEELIKELKLETKVFLLGQKFNPMPYVKASDCFILSSRHEGQGLVLFEAMVLNKPVISTNIEGPRSVLENNLGYLVENSEGGLYRGMLKFLTSSLTLTKFNTKSYNQKAIDMFQTKVLSLSKTTVDSLDSLYKSAIEDFNNKKWKESFEKFTFLRKKSKVFSTLYYIKESRIRHLVDIEKKDINDVLIYVNHKFDSENFAGVGYLLEKAIENSKINSEQWRKVYLKFLIILEYIKTVDGDLESLLNKNFLNKIESLSFVFNNSLETDKLPYQVWFVFANIFILTRQYKKYYLARDKALQSVILTKRVPKVSFARYKINALVEINDRIGYDTLRNNLLKKDEKYIQQHLLLLGVTELYFNRHVSVTKFYQQKFSLIEKEFSDYIQNKSIAIVGPLNSSLKLGAEIDSYDIVLRFNYTGMEQFSEDTFGTKTDISFYISQLLPQERIDSQKISFMNRLDWIIMDTIHGEKDICFLGIKKPLRKRFYAGHIHVNPFFKGTPSGIQRAIMDLMRFNISKIKIFNTNLFLDNNYDKSYKSHGKKGVDYFDFIRHDPLSNFIFLKSLKENALIETDDILAKILKMSKEEYIEALENQYGNKI